MKPHHVAQRQRNQNKVLLRLWQIGLLLCLPLLARADQLVPLSDFPTSRLTIETTNSQLHAFNVWVADTPARSQQGLMGVSELPDHTGMLFVFDHPQRIAMWMKNTLIPLDMLFINANGQVESLIEQATPMSEKILPSRGLALGVLELKGGTAKSLNIHAGAVIRHAAFGTIPATR